MNIIGIDIGSSLIKIIEVNEKSQIINSNILEKCDIKEVLNDFIKHNNIDVKEVSKIVLTGIGADKINEDLLGIKTIKVDELTAIGMGGTILTDKNDKIIISIGTGTAFIKHEDGKFTHIGGTGVGGGTFINLCKALTGEDNIYKIRNLIENGCINNVNLTINDITKMETDKLLGDITVANLGKLNKKTNKEDIAIGILNMVMEVIGMMAAFTVQSLPYKEVVLTGSFITCPKAIDIIKRIEKIQDVKFVMPKTPEFATILGAISMC